MKILVTGGAGFMGSNFIRYILKKYPKYSVICYDKLTYAGNLDNLKDIKEHKNYSFIKGDIVDGKKLEKIVKKFKIDVILNYAAETHVDRSILDPSAFLYTDIIGVYNILEICKNQNKLLIQVSTDEVFGETENPRKKFSEDSCFRPKNPYSASKAGGDLLIRSYVNTYKVKAIETHSCNFFGPYHYPEKLIPLFITNLLERKNIPLYRGGENNFREWIYTEDHCKAIDIILHKGKIGEVYNIGTGNIITNINLTRKILTLLKKDKSSIQWVKDRPGHDKGYAINFSKLKKMGFRPRYNLDKGLKLTIEWYKKNKWWWKKLKDSTFQKYYKKNYRAIK